MAYKMNNSPVKLMWPWSKGAKRKREQRRNIRNFRKNTVAVDGKTYDKDEYDSLVESAETPNPENIEKFSAMSNKELEALRSKYKI